jgi:hypothetical protein
MARPRPQQGRLGASKDDALRMEAGGVQLSDGASRCVEGFACLEHGVHNDREFARYSHGSAPEAQPFAQFEPPVFEAALGPGAGSGQDRCRRFKEQAAQMAVASSRDMAVIIDLARLIATRR